jgi:hypothetical protein
MLSIEDTARQTQLNPERLASHGTVFDSPILNLLVLTAIGIVEPLTEECIPQRGEHLECGECFARCFALPTDVDVPTARAVARLGKDVIRITHVPLERLHDEGVNEIITVSHTFNSARAVKLPSSDEVILPDHLTFTTVTEDISLLNLEPD